jgi:hypothetical protein
MSLINEKRGVNSEVVRFSEELYKILSNKNLVFNNGQCVIQNGNVPLSNGTLKQEFYLNLPGDIIFKFDKIIIKHKNKEEKSEASIQTNSLKPHEFTLTIPENNLQISTIYHEITHLFEITIKAIKDRKNRSNNKQQLYNTVTNYMQNIGGDNFVKNLYFLDKMETNAEIHEIYKELLTIYQITPNDYDTKLSTLPFIKIINKILHPDYIEFIDVNLNQMGDTQVGQYYIKELCTSFKTSEEYLPNKIDKYLKRRADIFLNKILKLNELILVKTTTNTSAIQKPNTDTNRINKQNIFTKIKNFLIGLKTK